MANRYWVGGTGTWNGTSTTNWSASSGGASGASVPTSADNVFFDANSNTGTAAFTVTMATTAATCADFDASVVDGVMTLAGTVALDVYGSLSFPPTNRFTRSYTGLTTFRATTTGKTISFNGANLNNVTFDGVGGGWTLSNAFLAFGSVTLTNGSINLNGFTWTNFSFSSNNSNARTLEFNGGSINLTASTTSTSATLWSCATVTNFTITGTPTVNATADSTANTRTFSHGSTAGGSENNTINLTILLGSNSANLITVQGVYKNLNFSSISSTLNNSARTIYGNLTISNNMTLTAGSNTTNFSGANATQLITSGGRNFNFPINFGYFYATTAATGNGTTATLTFASTSNIPAVGSTIIVSGVTPAGYNGTYTVTASTNTTVSYLNATTGAQTVAGTIVNGGSTTYTLQDALNVGTSTSRTITLNTGTLDLNNFTLTNFGAFQVSTSSTPRGINFGTGNITCTYNLGASNTVWNCTVITGFTVSGTPTVNITGTSSGAFTRTISHGNTSGATEANSITVNVSAGSDTVAVAGGFLNFNLTGFSGTLGNSQRSIYGNLTLPSGLSITGGFTTTFASTNATTRTITTNGNNLNFPITFNGVGGSWQLQDALSVANQITLTNGSFSTNTYNITCSNFNFNNSNTKTLTINSKISVLSSGTFQGATTNTTFNLTGSEINFNNSFGIGTFNVPNATFPLVTTTDLGNLLIGASGTSQTITTLTTNNSIIVYLFAGSTLNVSNLNLYGDVTTQGYLQSSVSGTRSTISKTNGTVIVNYLYIQDIIATGGATWKAPINYGNTDGGNNIGWDFGFYSPSNGNFLMLF